AAPGRAGPEDVPRRRRVGEEPPGGRPLGLAGTGFRPGLEELRLDPHDQIGGRVVVETQASGRSTGEVVDRLRLRLERRPAAQMVEFEPAFLVGANDPLRGGEVEPPVDEAVRQAHEVRREPVASDMRGLPELVSDLRREAAGELAPRTPAADVASPV